VSAALALLGFALFARPTPADPGPKPADAQLTKDAVSSRDD
jgi:hypothetical protein